MPRPWKIALSVLVVVLVLAGLARCVVGKRGGGAGGFGGGDGGDDAPVPVTVQAAQQRDVPVYLTAQGTVSALNTVTVSPQVGGQLLSVNFREGQAVKKGELLAQIDPRSLQASYDQAAASRRQAEAQLATAQSNYKRSSDPAYSQYVSKLDLDTLRNQVGQYTAAVAAAAATMREAQVQLQYTKITSPIDGIAGIRGVDAGNIVGTSTQIVTITQVQPIHVLFDLPEKQLEAVRTAQAKSPLAVAALDRTDQHVLVGDGRLDVIDNQINSSTATFRLRALFPNADNALWPGQFVNVRLQLRTLPGALVVPSQAVQRGADGDYVYVVKADGTVEQRPVVQGVEVGDSDVVIDKGLAAGDRVVTEGQFRLKAGTKVNALAPGQAPPAPTEAELKAAQGQGKGGRGRRGGPPR
jgi:multidrug efflux system membrane fusion protein